MESGETPDKTDRVKPIKGETNILFVEKNRINFFSADLAPYDSLTYGSCSSVLKNTDEQLISMFKSGQYPFDYQRGQTTIDSLVFHRFKITVFTSDRSDTLFNQMYLTRLMNDTLSLAINLGYKNKAAQQDMYNLIKSSEFEWFSAFV